MKQTEAVDVIYSLLPRMKSAAPEEVLAKYAKDRGIAPAQLERLGHVYNTASTLSTLEKDRNASPQLMDVPALVKNYVHSSGSSKRASWLAEAPAVQAPEPVKQASTELPDVWNPRENYNYKAASAPKDMVAIRKRAFYAAVQLAERAIEAEADLINGFASDMNKIAREISREDAPLRKYATLEADIKALNPAEESEVLCGQLSNSLKSHGVDVISDSLEAEPFILARDRTGYHKQIEGACDKLKVASELRASLTIALETATKMASYLSDDPVIVRQAQKTAHEVARVARASGLEKEAQALPVPKPTASSYGDQLEAVTSALHRNEAGDNTGLRHLIRPGFGLAADAASATLAGGRSATLEQLPQLLTAFSDEGTAAKLLKPYADRNATRAQNHSLDREQIAHDTRSVAKLKKIMMRDEIISTKDPQKVFEAYTSIRHASPEVAEDEGMLTLLLRQALETQGMDIDTAQAARKYEYGGYKKDLPGAPTANKPR